jgi:uncharacterized DUF497 family protein
VGVSYGHMAQNNRGEGYRVLPLVVQFEGRLYVLVYTLRRDEIRIISARKANPREVRSYENRSHEN